MLAALIMIIGTSFGIGAILGILYSIIRFLPPVLYMIYDLIVTFCKAFKEA
ncbi:hypothetical protein JCM16358_23190 [Halanaerocella petrolearia]